MNTTGPQPACPNCTHPHHLPGTECATPVHHGPNRWHLCLCLARPGAALSCPPQMTCQGGTLGYADIWYLQHGHVLVGEDGTIAPAAVGVGVASVGFPSGPDLVAAAPAAVPPAADRAALRDRIAGVIHADLTTHKVRRDQGLLGIVPRLTDAVLSVLPASSDPTDVRCVSCEHEAQYHDVNGRCWFTVEQGVPERDSVCACQLRRMAAETPQPTPCSEPNGCDPDGDLCDRHETERAHAEGEHASCGPGCDQACTCGVAGDAFVPLGHYANCPQATTPAAPAQPAKEACAPETVAYRSPGGRLLRCLAHAPEWAAILTGDFHPVTSDDLPDGGICTYPECGVDVLIPQQPKEA